MSSEHAHGPDASTPWKHDGVRVVPADQLDPNTAQTPGMNRKAAINFARVGAQKLWAGTVHIHPDAKTGAHHHGHLESVIYIVKGRARMRWGEHLEFTAEAGPGDFIYIPPYVPHQEINASADETLECVLCRSDGEAMAVNLDIEPVEKPETVRWIDPTHPHGGVDEALGPRPVGLARRQQRGRGDPRYALARRALRAARLLALLAERAPRPADHRRLGAGDPDGGDRCAHDAHPHRQRRRDAAALQRPQGGRAVPGAGGARARAHRSRRRPRAGRRHADRARPQSERQPRRRGLPGAGARPARLDDARQPRRASPPIRSGRTRRRSGSSAAPTTARSSPRTSACPMPSPTSSPTGRAPRWRWQLYRQRFQPSERHPRAAGDALHLGAGGRRATRRRRTWRCRAIAGASTGSAARSGRCSRRRRSPSAASPTPSWRCWRRCAARPSSARAATVGAKIRKLAADFELDEVVINTWALRPGGAAPLLCADGRGIRAVARLSRRAGRR